MGKDLYLWAYFHNLAIQTAPAASAQTITQLLLTENPLWPHEEDRLSF